MSNVRIQGNSSGTGTLTFQAPNTNTDRTLNIPDNAGTFITTESTVPPKVPSFSVNISTTPSFSTATKVPFNTVVFDTDSWFDTTNNRYTPQQAGYYFFDFIYNTSGSNTPTYGVASLRKNGTIFADRFLSISNNQFNSVSICGFIDLNGSTDYVDIGIFQNSGSNKDTVASPSNNLVNHFSGCYMRGSA